MQLGLRDLPYGVFFGTNEVHRELPGFSVSLLSPTLRAEEVPLHTHQNASFVLVLAGAYVSSADGAPAPSPEPLLLFNPAGTTHRDSFRLASGRFLGVSISEETCRIAADGLALLSAATAFPSQEALTTAFSLAAASSGDAGAMEGLCWELISVAARRNVWTASQSAVPLWIKNARDLLHDQCTKPLPLAQMAATLGVHPVYFARAFRKTFGCTPGEYQMRCRMEKVMGLLRNARLSLSEVALEAGFFDQSHLTRMFRKHFGFAPHAYRTRLQVQSVQDPDSESD